METEYNYSTFILFIRCILCFLISFTIKQFNMMIFQIIIYNIGCISALLYFITGTTYQSFIPLLNLSMFTCGSHIIFQKLIGKVGEINYSKIVWPIELIAIIPMILSSFKETKTFIDIIAHSILVFLLNCVAIVCGIFFKDNEGNKEQLDVHSLFLIN